MLQPLPLARNVIAASALAGVLCYAAAALITVADIIGRRFDAPIVGVVDLVQLFVLGGAWLVIPFAFLRGSHVAVDLLVQAMPRLLAEATRHLTRVLALILLALMLSQCYQTFQQQLMFGDRSQQIGIPIAWYWVPLLVGLGLSIVAVILTFFPSRPSTSA